MKQEKDEKGRNGQTQSEACTSHSVNKYLLCAYLIPVLLFTSYIELTSLSNLQILTHIFLLITLCGRYY